MARFVACTLVCLLLGGCVEAVIDPSRPVRRGAQARSRQPEYDPNNLIVKYKGERNPRLVPKAANLSLQATMSVYDTRQEVEYVSLNYIVRAMKEPNDPGYKLQWHLSTISAPTAWDTVTGNDTKAITVCVVDTGVAYDHPDLAANWVRGITVSGGVLFGNGNDDNKHGTHCAGIIGAVANNGAGVSGVNWRVGILGCKFLDAKGSGSNFDAAICIKWCTEQGSTVISASFGGGDFDQGIYDAIRTSKALFVAAAGNEEDNKPGFPAAYGSKAAMEARNVIGKEALSNVIAVAATTSTEELSWFSNYNGDMVHVAAPGSNILSTVLNGGYTYLSGTSMATPIVSGAAALLLKAAGGKDAIAPATLRHRLMSAFDTQIGLNGKVITNGRLNINKLIQDRNLPIVTTCFDRVKNGQEADVDCGGVCIIKCANGRKCSSGQDCASKTCQNGLCAANPLCSDLFKNQDEGDTDCGGICGSTCQENATCNKNSDCASRSCGSSGRCLSGGGSCKDKCGLSSNGCWCDSSCKSEDDCCPDYDAQCQGSTGGCKDNAECAAADFKKPRCSDGVCVACNASTCAGTARPRCVTEVNHPSYGACTVLLGASGCSNSSHCFDGQCLQGSCRLPPGSSCTSRNPTTCSTSVCSSGTCRVPLGSSGCAQSSHCVAGECISGTCLVPLGGTGCTVSTGSRTANTCAAGTCAAGSCRVPLGSSGCRSTSQCARGECLQGSCKIPVGSKGCGTSSTNCASGQCISDSCKVPLGSAGCAAAVHCSRGQCLDGTCLIATGTRGCGTYNSTICAAGASAVCVQDTCRVALGGQGCSSSAQCVQGECQDGQCLVPTGARGCGTNGGLCAGGADQTCNNNTCQLLNGGTCVSDLHCTSGQCVMGRCGAP